MSTPAEQQTRVSGPAAPLLGIPAAVWAIAGGAVVLRLIHAWLMVGDPLYDHPIIDSLESLELASYLAEISWFGPPVAYWKPPLYDYFLGVHHALFGSGLWPARISQVLLDGCSCILAFALVRRLLSHGAGIVAAAVVALWGPLIYFSSVHVSTSLVVFLELCVLLLAVRAQREPSRPHWMDVGFSLGVLAIARAEALLLAPWLAGWLWWSLGRYPRRKRLIWVALLAIGVTVGVAPVALRNALYARDPVLISANGGVNFYIGSAPEYRGVIGVRPGPEWELLMRAPIDVGYETEGERSQYHFREARALIASDPIRWVAHTARKLGHVWHGRELPSNRDLYGSRGHSVVLSALLWHTSVLFFPFGLLVPLAIVGMGVSWRERRDSRFLIGLVAIHCATLMLFFVTSRFRIVMVPVLVLFAAEAVVWAFDRAREKRTRTLVFAGIAVAVLFPLVNLDVVLRSDPDAYAERLRVEEHVLRGIAFGKDIGRLEEGKAELLEALALAPDFVAIYYNLAQLYEKSGDDVAALRLFRRVLGITERSPAERYIEPSVRGSIHRVAEKLRDEESIPQPLRHFALGIDCLDGNRLDCAIAELRAASIEGEREEVAPLLGIAHLERGRVHLRVKRNAAALMDFTKASELRPHDPFVYAGLGVALERARRPGQARAAFRKFRIYDLPRGEYYRRAIESGDAMEREIALVVARAVVQQYPRDRYAREAVERLLP
jgi:4-amino-4-deoxy-L-arabinose transferase-like glycosyltransferase